MSKLTFKILGSGYMILLPAADLPEPYNAVQFGKIDKEVDGFYYWVPDTEAIKKGSVFPAWLLRGIADEIDRLNEENKEELDMEELLRIHYNEKRIKARLDVEGQKPYSMEELEATKFTRQGQNYLNCDHKFVDSNCCLKCGWIPG